ncbi:hypothetical protein GCM10027589_16760 [Actinocorallia lasiicapitis]
MGLLGGVLAGEEHDVVCLQEVLSRGNLALAARSFPHVAVSPGPVPRGGLAILSRWPVQEVRFVRYPWRRPVRPEWAMRKGVQIVRLTPPGGDALYVANTHLSANRDEVWAAPNRYTRLQAVELDRLATALEALDPDVPLIVAGDFNIPHDAPVLAGFAARLGLVVAGGTAREPTFRGTSLALDHLLTRNAPVTSFERRLEAPVRPPSGEPVHLSDHLALAATVVPGGQPSLRARSTES